MTSSFLGQAIPVARMKVVQAEMEMVSLLGSRPTRTRKEPDDLAASWAVAIQSGRKRYVALVTQKYAFGSSSELCWAV